MHGTTMKNIRRTEIPATKRGKPNPDYPQTATGPTRERLKKSDNHFAIGDDQRGGRLYQFHDSTIDRLYSRLTKQAASRTAEEQLRSEYISLQRYKHHWHHAGLESSIGSVDLNRIFAPDPSSMSGMPKSERQAHHRRLWREARELLGHKPGIVVENIMCAETSLEIAGFSVGYNSRTQARDKAEQVLRKCGRKLAKHWGIT